jgi:translation initiation factor 2B subunit (eIF-2B alpha/beta/delta family)
MSESFAQDRDHGSSSVARAFLSELERWSAIDRSASAGDLRGALLTHLRAAQAAQPSMALVHQFAARALEVADASARRGDSASDARAHLEASCAAERADLERGEDAAAAMAVRLLSGKGAWIATLSASGAVRRALRLAHERGLKPRALIAESRPRFEGRRLATELAAKGIPVWLVVDAALPLLLSQAAAVWLGADAVTERGVINKIGSFATALAAREHSVPVHAIGLRRKFLPASTSVLQIAEMRPEEVWDQAPETVKPRNVYFEVVPLALFTGIVVEDGVLGTTEAATLARERELPAELAAGH